LTTTKQIETRVKRQVKFEDGKVIEDSGPIVSTASELYFLLLRTAKPINHLLLNILIYFINSHRRHRQSGIGTNRGEQ
jgi:hypothetical protein